MVFIIMENVYKRRKTIWSVMKIDLIKVITRNMNITGGMNTFGGIN